MHVGGFRLRCTCLFRLIKDDLSRLITDLGSNFHIKNQHHFNYYLKKYSVPGTNYESKHLIKYYRSSLLSCCHKCRGRHWPNGHFPRWSGWIDWWLMKLVIVCEDGLLSGKLRCSSTVVLVCVWLCRREVTTSSLWGYLYPFIDL